MAAGLQGCVRNMEKNKPYFAMILYQFVYAGMSLLSKASISEGMNAHVFVVYRQAFATLALVPFVFVLERSKKSPPLSFPLLSKIFLVSTGITMNLNLVYYSLNYVSATFAIALTNTNLAITFVLAVCFRMESLNIKQKHGMSKVIGAALGLLGALLCTFVTGPAMYPESQKNILHLSKQTYTKDGWIKGSLIILAGIVMWCLWLILQVPLLKQYPAKLHLTALQCIFSCVTSAVWAMAMERNPESWKLGWDINLLSVFYCGVIVQGFGYWLLAWIVEKKGPVFSAAFSPLSLVITAIFSAIFFQETLHWGSFCGAMLLVIGLYGILWAKSKEENPEATERQEMLTQESERTDVEK
ncbi:WAT1-related protein At1g43650-like [Andrographis paniculata]|uniref:WAT1-related protein At1g43650-like n=1 Tax=Andrographis paniculata TaxID=175694 RepID=UPI0021E7AF84|nr:WAT1-related protein At1g43650-like [Andrographis paniculata]